VRWLFSSLAVITLAAVASPVSACPAAVRLLGDQALIADVTSSLSARGIATSGGECPALSVTLERRGQRTLLSAAPDGDRVETVEVAEVRTAATVIESWVRTDVEEPLLARRRADDRETPEGLVAAAPAREGPGVQILTLAETGFANDHTTWVGALVGACMTVGRVCLGGRARFATVAEGPGEWETAVDREAVDALADVEVPLRLGRLTLAPGLGLGLGWIHTHEGTSADARHSVGARLETHLALTIPLSHGTALEAAASLELAHSLIDETDAHEELPTDPGLLAHLGLGLRFGGP
jgi:hypothetical protein